MLFTCDEGYKLKGSPVRTCQSNGEWSGKDTKCVRTYSIALAPVHLETFSSRCAIVGPIS